MKHISKYSLGLLVITMSVWVDTTHTKDSKDYFTVTYKLSTPVSYIMENVIQDTNGVKLIQKKVITIPGLDKKIIYIWKQKRFDKCDYHTGSKRYNCLYEGMIYEEIRKDFYQQARQRINDEFAEYAGVKPNDDEINYIINDLWQKAVRYIEVACSNTSIDGNKLTGQILLDAPENNCQ